MDRNIVVILSCISLIISETKYIVSFLIYFFSVHCLKVEQKVKHEGSLRYGPKAINHTQILVPVSKFPMIY